MRRLAWIVVATSACGRFGFTPVGGSFMDGASTAPLHDTPVPLDAPANFDGLSMGFDYPNFVECPTALAYVDAAMCVGGELELTGETLGTVGAVWGALPYAFTPTTQLSMTIGLRFESDTQPADGMAIVLQADPRGNQADGPGGDHLGYSFITPSAALELDTYYNMPDQDPDANHIGMDRDGSVISLSTADPPFQMPNTTFTAWFDYDGPTTTLSAYIAQNATKPATPTLSIVDDLSRLGGEVYIGFVAGTGGLAELHHVTSWRLDFTP